MHAAFLLILSLATGADSSPSPVAVPSGRFAPLFGLDTGQANFAVDAFRIDIRPVSREDWASFLNAKPQWIRKRAPPTLVDERYLLSWTKEGTRRQPVVEVSYFAARAYCAWKGGRLPTTLEWEYVAAASETQRDASRDADFAQRILDWYAAPNQAGDLDRPGSPRNIYGVEALHGLVWEWTDDFNGLFVTGDNRQDGDKSASLMCGSGATGSARREDYAAFMRYALRSSLTPRTSLPNLGFRCAYASLETP